MAASLAAPAPGRSPPAHTAGVRTCKTCKRARPSREFYRGPWAADPREGTYRPSCASCATISAQLPRHLAPPRLRPPFGPAYQVLYTVEADPVEEIREKILAQLRVHSIPKHPLQARQLSARSEPVNPGPGLSGSSAQTRENPDEHATARPDQAALTTVSEPAEPTSASLKRTLPQPLQPHSEPSLDLARTGCPPAAVGSGKKKTAPRALQAINSHSSRRQRRCLPTMGPEVKPRSPLTMWADHQFRFGLKL